MRTPAIRHRALATSALSALLLVVGCSAMPGDGPRTGAIIDGANSSENQRPLYVLVALDEASAKAVAAVQPPEQRDIPADDLPRSLALGLMGPGDMLHVTLWEPNPTGATLLDKPGLDLPIRVGDDGSITVPYVGRLRAAGHTPPQVEGMIRGSLKSTGHDIQAAVLVSDDVTNAVFLQGDVGKPGRYPISVGTRGLLDVLALAGGSRVSAQAAEVRVTRRGVSASASLAKIAADPALDVPLAPGDRVMVLPKGRYFYAFGSVNRPGEQAYDSDELSLTRTLARVAGLQQGHANPSGVFIYRRQTADLTRRVVGTGIRADQDATKVIYQIDLRDPRGFFVAQDFRVQPEDIVYVSQAPLAEALQVMQIISGMSSVAMTPRNFGGP
jgi:polysaccharide biosynthesis/export protein